MRAEYPKIKVINKSLMAVQWNEGGTREILPNLFEAMKAYCLASAKGSPAELPYTVGVLDHRFEDSHPDLFRWYVALTDDNPPGPVCFRRRFEEYRELVEPIDFAKPFDEALAASIRTRFSSAMQVREEVDAETIIHGELLEMDV